MLRGGFIDKDLELGSGKAEDRHKLVEKLYRAGPREGREDMIEGPRAANFAWFSSQQGIFGPNRSIRLSLS